ncbi:hypothetical protein BU16DRAFT_529221 [Lophium mytilinum]|uniref:HD domain-containing protein n=1 Tax=Lophium mytilinum TaxID=390894 RepID=A0A6A6QLH3_9PEZI|nr:hypothetical protein BU16DRAFT_529221 [Lophium mytilinum]
MTPTSTATYILTLLTEHGEADYIGEPITQLAHSLQCAHFAALQYPHDDEYITAALLHDIGQFLPASTLTSLTTSIESMEGNVGRVGHETLGASYLRSLSFPPRVVALVAAHVPAKRFLCAVETEYYDALSSASKASLRFQGGPMSEEEVRVWKEGGWWPEMCRLRKCDDAAKEVDLEVAGVEAYRGVIERCLEGVGA